MNYHIQQLSVSIRCYIGLPTSEAQGEHIRFTEQRWRTAVRRKVTQLGYGDWVAEQIQGEFRDFPSTYNPAQLKESQMSNTLTRIEIPHIESPALNALAVLAVDSPVSFGLALAGGHVRDVALGRTPGDQDIIIFDFDDAGQLIADVDAVMLKAGYDLHTVDDSEEYAEARVWMVRQYSHEVYPEVDILFHPTERSVQEVLIKHDYNINNYCVVVDDICDSERQTAYFVGDNPQGVLVRQPYQESIGFDRQHHIVTIADEVGWSVPPRFRNSGSSHPDLFKG